MLNALDFWLKSNHRWALFIEAVQASMKANFGKNLSLVDAVINSTVYSQRHEANIYKRQAGKRAQVRGPTGVELGEREKMR